MAHAQQPDSGSGDPFRDPPPPDFEKRSIHIENRTGSTQRYVVFMGRPALSESPAGKDLQIVCAVHTTKDGQTAQFDFPLDFMAIHGSASGPDSVGASFHIIEAQKVELGVRNGADFQSGTSIGYTIQQGVPQFRAVDGSHRGGTMGCFEIVVQSGHDFTLSEARAANLFIGIGMDSHGHGPIPLSVFSPMPSTNYQVQPQLVYTVITGNYPINSFLDAAKLATSITCDFTKSDSQNFSISHNKDGTLVMGTT